MKKSLLTVLAVGVCWVGMAGMANASIVNINAYAKTGKAPVTKVWFESGTYHIDPIGVAEGGKYNAWNLWNRFGNQPAPGWLSSYSFSSAEFGAKNIGGGVTKKYKTALIALANAKEADFTLKSSGYVSFYINDSPYWDNIGGMSLNVTKKSEPTPTPVPAPMLLLGSGLLGLIGRRRKKE